MKLVLLFQSLLGVAVIGRSIDEPTDTSVTSEEHPYQFRYQVADEATGDFKSQSESRDDTGIVTGMYQVLQPDVTYEGDCQHGESINPAAEVKSDATLPLEDVSAPINPSAFLSRPVHSAVPGLTHPITTDVQDAAHEAFVPRPSHTSSSEGADAAEKVIIAPLSTISDSITHLWHNIGQEEATGPVESVDGRIEEHHVSSFLKSPASVSYTATAEDVVSKPAETVVESSAINAVPETLIATVQTSRETVPDSVVTLLNTFSSQSSSASSNKNSALVDPLIIEASEYHYSVNEPESIVIAPSSHEISHEEISKETKGEEEEPKLVEDAHLRSVAEIGETKSAPHGEDDRERSIASIAQFAQATVQNLTDTVNSTLSQLISSVTVPKPIANLFQGFNKKPEIPVTSTTTVAPTVATITIAPVVVEAVETSETPLGKIPAAAVDGEAEQISSERVVTDPHDEQLFSEEAEVKSDIPASESHEQHPATLSADETSGGEQQQQQQQAELKEESVTVDAKTPLTHNLESISIEINDRPTAAEPVATAHVSEESAAEPIASADHFASAVSVAEEVVEAKSTVPDPIEVHQPVEQVHDAHETAPAHHTADSTFKEAEADVVVVEESDHITAEDSPVADPSTDSYAIVAPVPGAIVFSQPLEAGAFVVHHPVGSQTSRSDYLIPTHQARTFSTPRMPYGMRVQTYVPTYIYNQHRRQAQQPMSYGRNVVPAAAPSKKRDFGMRHAAVHRTPPTNSHYAARPVAAKQTPLYSTSAY